MSRERNKYVLPEVSQETLIRGRIRNPFNETETKVLECLRDGMDSNFEIGDQLGLVAGTITSNKGKISAKVRAMYSGEGDDNLAKAISLAILGGWIKPVDTNLSDRTLTHQEFSLAYFRSFGFKPDVIQKNLGLKPREYIHLVRDLKDDLGLKTDLQIVAWGASKAREKLLSTTSQ